ncbi:winged helix-turn-helix domain-containing protein [Glaciihabitans sp. UYNi722]|uniref:ArsR/SmtB family transcription factor n=1 Tax=Glaciihabitans sp. UYNi722 TaxID=3156344 RepID=UPI00339176C9
MEESTAPDLHVDLETLKGLAHPLRIQILDALSTYGPFTASGLGERLGESSGATSYHLRQLEKHGFVNEIEGRGTGRERWWERTPGSITFSSVEMQDTAVGRVASDIVLTQWQANRDRLLREFTDRGPEELSREWQEASMVSTASAPLTIEQLRELSQAWDALLRDFVQRYRGQQVPGSRPVQVQFNAFPVVDGVEVPLEPAHDPVES